MGFRILPELGQFRVDELRCSDLLRFAERMHARSFESLLQLATSAGGRRNLIIGTTFLPFRAIYRRAIAEDWPALSIRASSTRSKGSPAHSLAARTSASQPAKKQKTVSSA
jgi:hypothetical protein